MLLENEAVKFSVQVHDCKVKKDCLSLFCTVTLVNTAGSNSLYNVTLSSANTAVASVSGMHAVSATHA